MGETSAGPGETRPDSPLVDEWIHRDDLIHYARRLLGGQGELAEDLVQEAFLRLHERAASGARVRDARPWLFRVTRNLALDERRRARRGDAARASLEVVAAGQPGPHEVLQGREEARQALRGLGALPPREQRTVLLDQAGLTPPAIARLMSTTTNAVHQSLFRARRRLRETRAAAWALLPVPVIRLLLRAANGPELDQLPALAPGSGGRLAGGAGVAGLLAAAVFGGGVVVTPPQLPHHRPPAVESAAAPSAPPEGGAADDPQESSGRAVGSADAEASSNASDGSKASDGSERGGGGGVADSRESGGGTSAASARVNVSQVTREQRRPSAVPGGGGQKELETARAPSEPTVAAAPGDLSHHDAAPAEGAHLETPPRDVSSSIAAAARESD